MQTVDNSVRENLPENRMASLDPDLNYFNVLIQGNPENFSNYFTIDEFNRKYKTHPLHSTS